jgi:large subunit ribosomal protein L32
MAVPKKKVSSARRDKRRSNNSKLEAPTLEKCACGEFKLHGRVCPKCGTLNGDVIVAPQATK